MNNNEWKVATLEQCQKLKDIGVLFKMFDYKTDYYWLFTVNGPVLAHRIELGKYEYQEFFPAPDAAELGLLLPEFLAGIDGDPCWYLSMFEKVIDGETNETHFAVSYRGSSTLDRQGAYYKFTTSAKNEAEARCAAYIWLVENDYID